MSSTSSYQARPYALHQVTQALDSKSIQYQIEGRQVNADLHGTGHFSIKITPSRGLFFDASAGKGGTITRLLRKINAEVPATSAETGMRQSQQSQDTVKDANKIWLQSWLCSQDLPADWDKGLNVLQKGLRREKLERQRETVLAYLTSRLGPVHVHHWIRHVRISKHGLMMITPMGERGKKVLGIQRTFFDENGNKTERKMLGHKGVQVLPPPAGVLPRDLGAGKCNFVGEGWETVAASVQAGGWRGIVTYDDGGILRWAKDQAEKAKKITQDQIDAAPASIFLVDRDASQTGQKACAKAVKIMRKAGLKAFYAVPPTSEHGGPDGGVKGIDWGDYGKEGINSDVMAAHLALAVAHGDQEMPEDVDDEEEDLGHGEKKWRPAKNPQTTVATRPTQDVRNDLQTELQKTVMDYMNWLKDKDKSPFAPVLMMPTTGTGKSTAAKALVKNVDIRMGGRVCVFVPDHDQASEYEDAGFFHFFGRNPDQEHPGYCPNHEDAKKALEQGHISQAELCKNCTNGFAWQIRKDENSDSEKAQKKVAKAKKILRSRGLNWEEVEACVWQDHLRDALESQFVVAASGSYSHSLTRNSFVVFDEHFEPGKGYQITMQDVDHWARRNQKIIDSLDASGSDHVALVQHKKAAEFFEALASAMAKWVGKSGSVLVDEELTQAIRGIIEAAKKANKNDDDVALADWETLRFNASGELNDNPLRAAHAISESLKFGDGHVENGALVVAASLPVMERLSTGEPTIVMDATPDPVIIDVVSAQSGRIVSAIAKQKVRIKRYVTRFWGLTALNIKRSGIKRHDKEIEKYQKIMQYHEIGTDFLFHKKVEDVLDPDDMNSAIGHWGKHHRAHNAWSGKPLVIVGSFFPPMEAWRGEYQRSRIAALSAGANPENWPAWRDDMKVNQREWICEGSHEVKSNLPLPDDDRIRAWLLNRVTAETVQAIGRARGANSETTLEIHIYGGVPLYGLWEHGLSVDSYHDDPECLGQTKDEHMAAMHEQRHESLARCDALAARIIAQGKTVTREALQCAVDEINAELEATRHGRNDGSYLYGGGMNIYTTPVQIPQPVQMPHPDVIQAWIKQRMPVLSSHLSTKGRNGKLVREAQEIAKKFGETALADAMKFAENLVKTEQKADNIEAKAWHIIENDPHATDTQIAGSRLALTSVGATRDVPAPWTATADDSKGSAR